MFSAHGAGLCESVDDVAVEEDAGDFVDGKNGGEEDCEMIYFGVICSC